MGLFTKDDPAKQLEKELRKEAERETQARPIDVFTIPNLPGRKYTALGMISAETYKHVRFTSTAVNIGLDELVEKLKKKTRELGGDAILGFQMHTLINQDHDHWATSYAYATAIAYEKSDEE